MFNIGNVCPHNIDIGVPWIFFDGEVSIVLKSACASNHITPNRWLFILQNSFAAAILEIAIVWSPPINNGLLLKKIKKNYLYRKNQ